MTNSQDLFQYKPVPAMQGIILELNAIKLCDLYVVLANHGLNFCFFIL